jgi:hypothetical protein
MPDAMTGLSSEWPRASGDHLRDKPVHFGTVEIKQSARGGRLANHIAHARQFQVERQPAGEWGGVLLAAANVQRSGSLISDNQVRRIVAPFVSEIDLTHKCQQI